MRRDLFLPTKSGRSILCMLAFFAFALCLSVTAQNPILPADQYIRFVREVPNAALYHVHAPSPVFADVNLPVLHLWGTSQEMGYAHGYIYADEIMNFLTKRMPNTLNVAVKEMLKLESSSLPPFAKELFAGSEEELLPHMVKAFLRFIVRVQTPYLNQTQNTNTLNEIYSIAAGICDNWRSRGKECNYEDTRDLVVSLNFFPDLVRMSCSITGTWGAANAPGFPDLIQMRALDFGSGPFPNASMLVIHHPTEPNRNSFASLTFPGFAAVVTGVSTKIGLSEKVWLSRDPESGSKHQPGSYFGEADVMVMRRMIEYANDIDEAVEIANTATRTWGIWLGIGQKKNATSSNGPMHVLQYRRSDVTVHDDKTLPVEIQGDQMDGVMYVDLHPQPSSSAVLGKLLKSNYGQITPRWSVQNIPANTKSGDVHIAFFDFNTDTMYVSTGVTDANQDYPANGGKAHTRPFIEFDLQKLWSMPRPKF